MSLEPFEPMKQFEFEPSDPFEPPPDLAGHAVLAAEWRRGVSAAHWIARLAFALNAPFGFAAGISTGRHSYYWER